MGSVDTRYAHGSLQCTGDVNEVMNQVFHNCMDEFVMVYIDAVLVFSKDRVIIGIWRQYCQAFKKMSCTRLQRIGSSSKTELTFLVCALAKMP